MMSALAEILLRSKRSDAAYLADAQGVLLTYRQAAAAAETNARSFARWGLEDCNVALLADPTPEIITAHWSLVTCGATIVLLDPAAGLEENLAILRESDIDWLVFGPEASGRELVERHGCGAVEIRGLEAECVARPRLRQHRINGGEISLIVPTSGTYGRPKLVMLRGSGLVENCEAHAAAVGLSSSDRGAITLPIAHCYAYCAQLLSYTAAGMQLLLDRRPLFMARPFCETLARGGVTTTCLVPLLLEALDRQINLSDYDLSRLRLVCFGGAPARADTLSSLRRKLTATGFAHTYGLSEASPRVSTLLPDEIDQFPSIGRPLRGVEISVRDEAGAPAKTGELWVRGPSLMTGYYRAEAATTDVLRDGWLLTGDLAVLDDRGEARLAGRKSSLVTSGGVRFNAEEVEGVLNRHPAIAVALIISEQLPEQADEPMVLVELEPGAVLTLEELHGYLKGKIGRNKWPRRLKVCERLPRTASGKIRRTFQSSDLSRG